MMIYIKKTKIGEIINLQRGFDLTKNEMAGGNIPVVGSNGIIGFHNQYTTKAPCLTIGRSGSVGKLYFSEVDSWAHNTTLFIEDFKNNNPKYIYYLLKTLNLGIFHGGSVVPSLNRNVLYPLEVAFIEDLPTQEKIASILSSLDAKIELNRQINAQLEQIAKLLYDYWFVQFDFPDAAGKPYKSSGGKMQWNEELKRDIPEAWEVGSLSEIANITMGQSPSGETYNDKGNGMIFFQGCTDFGERFPSVRLFTTEPTRFAKKGNILLSVRAPVGSLNLANIDCCIGRGLASLNSKHNSNPFLWGVLKNFKQIFDRRNMDGTTFGAITKEDLFSLKVVIPDEAIISSYQNILSPIFEKQDKLDLETQELTALRDWLLPMLMNGQVRVC